MATRLLTGLLAVLLAVQILQAGSAQDQQEIKSLLTRGERLLGEGNWYHAAKIFEELAGRYPESEHLGQFVFLRAKAKYYLGELNEAIAGFTYFLTRFPGAPETAFAHFFLGNGYYRLGEVDRAIRSYLEAYRLSGSRQLNDLVTASLRAAFQNASAIRFSETDLAEIPESKRCALVRELVDVLVKRGENQAARHLAGACDFELDLPTGGIGRSGSGFEIAMILPLSGELEVFGRDIYNGAVVAAEMLRGNQSAEFRLVPHDTRGNPIDAARIVGELLQTGTVAAIGPLTSEEAAVASARLSCGSLPLLIPAATQAGLTRLSETSFQLSPNIELQGVRAAEYAVNELQADSAVVFTPTGTQYLEMAQAFAGRFEQLGGTVLAVEYYRSRDRDFGPYINDVKAMLLGRHPDSMFFIDERGDTLDTDGLPAHIDCMFLPGDPTQIRLLLPQINFYNLTGVYLGTDSWADEAIVKLGDDVTKQAVFPSPFLTGSGSEEYTRFAAAYDSRFGGQPNRLAALGYDALTLVALVLAEESPSDLSEKLGRIQNYDGASGKITFGNSRENVEMPLYRIFAEQAVPLKAPADSTADSLQQQ